MLVDVRTVAQALELTPRRVQQLARQGWIPREEAGSYPLADCLTAYAAYLEEVEGRGGVGAAIDRARARKLRAQAELQEIELAVESGDLVEVEVMMDQLSERLATTRAQLMNLPRLADRLAERSRGERVELLQEELGHTLEGPEER